MKKVSTWAGIVGALFVIINVLAAASILNEPTSLHVVNVAILVQYLLWVLFGAFLVLIFFKKKQKEETPVFKSEAEQDNDQSEVKLSVKRNWIFSLLITIAAISSFQIWFLNDYRQGLTISNLSIIFDIIFNGVLLYFAVHLIKNTKELPKYFFYGTVFYGVVSIVFAVLQGSLLGTWVNVLFTAYVIFAIKMPLNKTNHRIAHWIILPAIIVISVALAPFESKPLTDLWKKQALIEEQFSNNTGQVSSLYYEFTNKETHTLDEIQRIGNALSQRSLKLESIFKNLSEIKEDLQSRDSTIQQLQTLERVRLMENIFAVHVQQTEKMIELMDYMKSTNSEFKKEESKQYVYSVMFEVDSFQDSITSAVFDLNNSNLKY